MVVGPGAGVELGGLVLLWIIIGRSNAVLLMWFCYHCHCPLFVSPRLFVAFRMFRIAWWSSAREVLSFLLSASVLLKLMSSLLIVLLSRLVPLVIVLLSCLVFLVIVLLSCLVSLVIVLLSCLVSLAGCGVPDRS